MPAYEFSLLLRPMARTEMTAVLKRVGTLLLDHGVVLQRLENLGLKDLPHRMCQAGQSYMKGHYFVYSCMINQNIRDSVNNVCKQDLDLLRFSFVQMLPDVNIPCTLDDEFKPPALRPSVLKLIEDGKKYKKQRRIAYKHERDYNWFDIYM